MTRPTFIAGEPAFVYGGVGSIWRKWLVMLEKVAGYLEAEGFRVETKSATSLVGRRIGLAGDTEYTLVWVPTVGQLSNFSRHERRFIGEFASASELYPAARKFLVLQESERLGQQFRSSATYMGVRIVVPAQFFDTAMTFEQARGAAVAMGSFRNRGSEVLRQRVAQPFVREGDQVTGEDLLPVLSDELRSNEGNVIHLVVGSAGMGKTFLFEALFAELYDSFQTDKNRSTLSRRPFPLLPEIVRGRHGTTDVASLGQLLDDLLASEFARPLSRDVFA